MRIGEILVAQDLLRATELARALAEQAETGLRLCSLLIGRGLVPFDDAAKALSSQKGLPCALHKHLELRDRDLATKLPSELARACCALPIARTRSQQLIIAVRDPAPQLQAALEQAAGNIVMIVAPASPLERLVAQVYGEVPGDEFDVDLSTGPIALPPKPDMSLLDPDSIQLALTSLDDVRVAKDPSQSGHLLSAMSTPTFTAPTPMTSPIPTLPDAHSIEITKRHLDRAQSRDAATEEAMGFISTRWLDAVVLVIRGRNAVGYRAYGEHVPAIETIVIPLDEPSTVARAVETRRTSVHTPEGAAQQEVESMLGTPQTPAAAPVLVGGHVVAVIAVGDPVTGDFDESVADLGLLAEALSGAYERIHGSR